jgi:hypothetical protein
MKFTQNSTVCCFRIIRVQKEEKLQNNYKSIAIQDLK